MLVAFVTAAVFSKGIVVSKRQSKNMLLASVTAAVLSKGIVVKDAHPLNMLPALVTAAVLSKGISLKDTQFSNMLVAFVTAAVLNNGTVARLLQLRNMLLMFVTAEVLAVITTSLKARNPENKEVKDVQLPMLRNAARSHIANLTFVPPRVNPEAPKLVALNSISNHPVSYA
jgi:hypothetical protein